MSRLHVAIANAIHNYQEGIIQTYDQLVDQLDKDINNIGIKVWREDETVKLPTYAKDGDACMDVYVHSVEFKDDGRVVYHTGLHFALPEDYEMEIRPRSSNTKTTAVVQNSPGTLDMGYRGELLVVMRDMIDPVSGKSEYGVGDRCAQILVRQRQKINWQEVKTKEDLGITERGDGGFGSTNK